MQIRQVEAADIPLLEQRVKVALGRTFTQELLEQNQGIHSVFIAIENNEILGWSFIRWLGPRDPKAAELFPEAPEIYRLEVREELRSKGIGRQIISVLENAALANAYSAVSLGVAHDNARAYALYKELGYQDTPLDAYYDEYAYPLPGGGVGHASDLCRYLVKRLAS